MYEIIYERLDDRGNESRNINETFSGTRRELQAYIKTMQENGCFNITATVIREDGGA